MSVLLTCFVLELCHFAVKIACTHPSPYSNRFATWRSPLLKAWGCNSTPFALMIDSSLKNDEAEANWDNGALDALVRRLKMVIRNIW